MTIKEILELNKLSYSIMEALINNPEAQKKFQEYMDLSAKLQDKCILKEDVEKIVEFCSDWITVEDGLRAQENNLMVQVKLNELKELLNSQEAEEGARQKSLKNLSS